jgi:serine/threonine protein kinase
LEVGDRVGEYVLDAKVGEGAFGEVWRARHRVFEDVQVALKLPRDARALGRLRDEGVLSRRVDADGAVRLLGIDLEHDPPYIALDYVEGETLRDVIRRGPVEPSRALAISRRVFGVLDAAHKAHVIHRDVKPENILIDRAGAAFLTDFGLAAALEAAPGLDLASSLGSGREKVVGTLRYLSPEQKDPRRAIDHRSDLYSAGLVLFETLTGTLPEGGEVPSDLLPGIDPGFDRVFTRCYARLERRYRSAAEAIAALDAIALRQESPIVLPVLRTERPPRDPPVRSPEGMPNLIGWDEARTILRVSDADLHRFVDCGSISRVGHAGQLFFRRHEVVDLRGRLRRVITPTGLAHYVSPRPARPPVVLPAPAPVTPAWLRVERPAPLRPAGPFPRALAFLVDALAIGAFVVLFGTDLFAGPAMLLAYAFGGPQLVIAPGVVDAGSVACLAFLYFAVIGGILGRTFGKWLFGLKVVDPSGEPIGVGRSAARALGYVVSAIPLGLGFVGMALHPEYRGFHDLVADSLVVYE